MAEGSNLSISLGADTSKLRADLAVAQAEVRQFGSELRAAAKESIETGDKSKVSELAEKYDAAAGKVTQLKGALSSTKPELEEHASLHQQLSGHLQTANQHLSNLHQGVTQLGATMQNIATSIFPGFNQIFLAFGAITSIAGIYELVKATGEWGHKLDGLAQSMGASQNMVKTFASAAKEGMVEFDQLASGLVRFDGKLDAGADKQRGLFVSMAEQLQKAGGIDGVLRPDPPSEWALGRRKIEATHNIEATKFKDSKEREKAIQERERALSEYDAANWHKRAPSKLIDFGDPDAFAYDSKNFNIAFGTYQEELRAVVARMEQGGPGAAGLQLPDFEPYLAGIQKLYNQAGEAGKKYREDFAKAGGTLAAKNTLEQLERQMPGFNDSLISAGVNPLTEFKNETKDAASALREFLLGFQKWGEGKQIATVKEMMGRGAITPEMLNLLRKPVGTEGSLFPNGVQQGKNADVQHAVEQFEQIRKFELAVAGIKKAVGLAAGDVFMPMFASLEHTLKLMTPAIKQWATSMAQEIAPFLKKLFNISDGSEGEYGVGQGGGGGGGLMRTLTGLVQTARALGQAFSFVSGALEPVARGINYIFGTDIDGRALAITIALGGLTGGFTLLAPAVRLAGAAFAFLWANPIVAILGAIALAALTIYANWDKIGPLLAQAFENVKKNIMSLVDGFSKLIERAQAAGNAIASALGAGVSAGAAALTPEFPGATPGPGLADGGFIRGPGTGTSDSIPAFLSNGEFVLNAAATAKIGVGTLENLNSIGRYAMGGLVGPSLPAFAGGGAVGGGTPVHIHMGGRSFETQAAPSVASALQHEARTRLMLSTGMAPSFMGSR